MMTSRAATCIRVLTSPAPGAIAVVRLSGPSALSILERVFEPRTPCDVRTLRPEQLRFGRFHDDGDTIDDVLLAVAPISEKAADGHVVDINAHGGMTVVRQIVTVLQRLGAARDDNDRCNVWRATCVLEREIDALLARAHTRPVAEWLAALRASMPQALRAIAHRLQTGETAGPESELRDWLRTSEACRYLTDGATIALVGPVNAGKSTLANRLAGWEQSLASDQPGTTRDWVTGSASLLGIPVQIVDTAGLRETSDPLECEAMDRGKVRAESADVILEVVDGTVPAPAVAEIDTSTKRRITVINKADLGLRENVAEWESRWRRPCVSVSALRGDGIPDLVQRIATNLGLEHWAEVSSALVTPRQIREVLRVVSLLADSPQAAAAVMIERLIG